MRRSRCIAPSGLGCWSQLRLRAIQCLCYELTLRKMPFELELPLPVIYKGLKLDCGYRVDMVVAGTVVVEVKAVEHIAPVHEAQLLTYLRLEGWSSNQLQRPGVARRDRAPRAWTRRIGGLMRVTCSTREVYRFYFASLSDWPSLCEAALAPHVLDSKLKKNHSPASSRLAGLARSSAVNWDRHSFPRLSGRLDR